MCIHKHCCQAVAGTYLTHDVRNYVHVGHGCEIGVWVCHEQCQFYVFNNLTASFLQPSTTSSYVPVPDRNQILFCRVFQAHYRVWRTIAFSFCWRWVSYALYRCIKYSCIYTWALLLAEAQSTIAWQTQLSTQNTPQNNIWFLFGTAAYVFTPWARPSTLAFTMKLKTVDQTVVLVPDDDCQSVIETLF